MSDRVLHCWKDLHTHAAEVHGWGSDAWAETYVKPNATCVLERGHDGDHAWTDDDAIEVSCAAPEDCPS